MKPILVSFIGPSGAGKSTCFGAAHWALRDAFGPVLTVSRIDVAEPLRLIQLFVYRILGMEPPGLPYVPEKFKQDGKLLAFLAKHYESRLVPVFEEEAKKLIEKRSGLPLAIINTDCRNNAYPALKRIGFIFVRLEVAPEILEERRKARGDAAPFDYSSAVEQTNLIEADHSISNNGTLADLDKEVRRAIHEIIRSW